MIEYFQPCVFETRPAVVDRLGCKPEFSSIRDFQSSNTNQKQLVPDIQVNNNDDTYLIQEISKKYILIPKLRTTFLNNCIRNGTINENPERLHEMHLNPDAVPVNELKSNSHDSTDWKSKYEILNILKDEEKGKPTGNYLTGFGDLKQSVPKERYPENNQDQIAISYDNYGSTDTDIDVPKNYVNEYPEKDLPADTLQYSLPKDSGYSLNDSVRASEMLIDNTDKNENNSIAANVDQAEAVSDQLQNITLEYKLSDAPNIDISREVTDYHEPKLVHDVDVNITSMLADDVPKQSVQTINDKNFDDEYSVVASSLIRGQNEPIEQHDPADSEQLVYTGDNEIIPIEAMNYNSPSTLDVNDHILENENFVETSNDQEFTPNITEQMKTEAADIPQEQIYVTSNVDTVGQAEPVIEKIENQANVVESIEDFDAEQREMFYSEQTNEHYPSQDAHPIDYSQNEYSQNQDYAYYDNTEAEAYPGELNNEEVTEQYDPSYEQQYTGLDQAAEQQHYAEEYQGPEQFTDQADLQFEVQQYEQQFENHGNIEESLDIEDGYTAQKSEAPAVSAETPAVDETNEAVKSDGDNKTAPVVTGI